MWHFVTLQKWREEKKGINIRGLILKLLCAEDILTQKISGSKVAQDRKAK